MNFSSTTAVSKEGNDEAGDKPLIKWQNSEAKKLILEKLCASQDHPYWNIKPKEIIASNKKLFEPYAKNFASNVNRLKKHSKKHGDDQL